jgi:hypothetical protein
MGLAGSDRTGRDPTVIADLPGDKQLKPQGIVYADIRL